VTPLTTGGPAAFWHARRDVEVEDIAIPAGRGQVLVRVFRPTAIARALPVVLQLHGDREAVDDTLAREFAARAPAAVVAPERDTYPATERDELDRAYSVLVWIASQGCRRRLDGTRIVLAGESAGGTLVVALARHAVRRGKPRLRALVLLNPDRPTEFRGLDAPTDCDSVEELGGLPTAVVLTGQANAPPEMRGYLAKLRTVGLQVAELHGAELAPDQRPDPDSALTAATPRVVAFIREHLER
jgi:dienelactone hydrolase